MRCDDAVDRFIDTLMDELDPADADALAAHLDGCAACRAEVAGLRGAWDALGVLEGDARPAPSGRAARPSPRGAGWTSAAIPARAAAAASLLLIGGWLGRATAPGGTVGSGDAVLPGEVVRVGDEVPVGEAAPVGEAVAGADGSGLPEFLLLLRGEEPDRRAPEEQLVREYSAWAAALAERGALVAAGQLEDGAARWAVPAGQPDEASEAELGGYFVVRATDVAAAVALARASPHVGYGGVVEVRPVVGR